MRHGAIRNTGRNAGRADWPLTLVVKAPGETRRLGEILGEVLVSGDVVALTGELGAGKTCLTQGIARGLGVADGYEITSPTFTLVNEYPGRINLYHVDLYRLAGLEDIAGIGLEEYSRDGSVLVVEWAEKAKGLWSDKTLWLRIVYLDENMREITLSGGISKQQQFMRALRRGGF